MRHEEVELPAGEFVIREGEPVDRFAVLTEGLVEWVKRVGDEEVVSARAARSPTSAPMNAAHRRPEPRRAAGR